MIVTLMRPRHRWCWHLHASPVTICLTVFVAVVVTLVAVIEVVILPCRIVSVVVMEGIFTACSRRSPRNRQKTPMLLASSL